METSNIVIIVAIILFLVIKKMGQISPDMAKELLKNGAILIDVRSPGEFSGGSVKNAINLPLDEISQKISTVVPNKETPILVFCLSGSRSAMAKRVLTSEGFTNVHNLGSYLRARSIVS